MFQNKTLLTTALVAAFGAATLAMPAHAASGTIKFSGKVLADTCTIAVNGGATVTLPTVMTDDFAAAGDTAGDTPFTVALSDCDKNTATATMAFTSGSTVDTATGDLKNTAVNGSNVQVRLLNENNAIINTADSTNAPVISVDNQGTGTTQMTAQYVATDTSTAAGLVNTSVDFTLTYQ